MFWQEILAHLDADLWDGADFDDYLDQAVKQASSPTFALLTTSGRKISKSVQTTTYTILTSDELIICNSATPFTVTLPVASGSGQKYYVKNINTGLVTIEGDTSDTIDSASNQTLYQWESAILIDYAANAWVIV